MKPDLRQTLTIYGRNPVLEALQNPSLAVSRLHLAESNKPGAAIEAILRLAQQRNIPCVYHSKQALSRISRNGKQDQGVAADIHCPLLFDWQQLIDQAPRRRLLAVDRLHNPQNLGMLIRSACAGGIDGIILPAEAGNTRLSPLVIKASAGTLFKQPLYRCEQLAPTLAALCQHGYRCWQLAANAGQRLDNWQPSGADIFVLGNETDGVSPAVQAQCHNSLHIPMHNQVESLNVAVTAGVLAFLTAPAN